MHRTINQMMFPQRAKHLMGIIMLIHAKKENDQRSCKMRKTRREKQQTMTPSLVGSAAFPSSLVLILSLRLLLTSASPSTASTTSLIDRYRGGESWGE